MELNRTPEPNNLFLGELFDWNREGEDRWLRLARLVIRRLKLPWSIRRIPDPLSQMTTAEMRLNLWHFAAQTLAYDVPGDFASFGCFDGKTAVIYQKVLDGYGSTRRLHLYDNFKSSFHLHDTDLHAEVDLNFKSAGVRPGVIHAGDFRETLPSALPGELACLDIDCGCGGDPDLHAATLLHVLEHVYPRMTPGAVGVLTDYHVRGMTRCPDYNPGVRHACDRFFASRAEKVVPLWAGAYAQAYFRKR